MRRFLPLAIGVIGVLLVIPGAWFFPHYVRGVKSQDAVVALKPLVTIPLNGIWSVRDFQFRIPDTPQWKRIRRDWGDPDWIIAAASPEKYFAYCLPSLGLTIRVTNHGSPVPLAASHPPYTYSSDCAASSITFKAAQGTELTVSIIRSSERPLPSGEVIVVGGWIYTKDKLVGIALNEEVRPILAKDI